MIYRYKVILPQNKNFIRIYEVRSNSTLYAFHLFLQNDLCFSPDQQVFFRTYNKSGNQACVYGLFDTGYGSMDQMSLEMINKRGEETLHYVFDIFKERYLLLQLEGTEREMPRKTYPRTIMAQGGDPHQFREELITFDANFGLLELERMEEDLEE